MKRAFAAGGLVLALALAACGGGGHTLDGTLTVSNCLAEQGLSDIHDGTEVRIANERGKVLGVGQLATVKACVFSFKVTDLPDARFYSVEIGTGRGKVDFSKATLEQNGWKVDLTL